jgi:hypothetical protein
MKNRQVKFICDNCGKETEFQEENNSENKYPYKYSEGWIYIYQLNIKLEKGINFEIKDKHLCSEECLLSYIKNGVENGIKKRVLKELHES